jgi:hypothetical protein
MSVMFNIADMKKDALFYNRNILDLQICCIILHIIIDELKS